MGLGVDKGDEDVSNATSGLQALVQVSQSTGKDEWPTHAGFHEFATVTKEMHTATLVIDMNSIESHVQSVGGGIVVESEGRLFTRLVAHNKVHSCPWLKEDCSLSLSGRKWR